MTTAKTRKGNPALLPTCRQLVALHKSGHRGRQWQLAFARLSALVDLLDSPTEGTPHA